MAGARQAQLQRTLAAIRAQGLYRDRSTTFPEAAGGRQHGPLLDFCSNDYLGLANDARLATTLAGAAARYGVGSAGSPLLGGYSRAHAELEQSVCELTGRSRALFFASGYQANLALAGVFAAERTHTIVMDKLSHASLIDAGRLCPATLRRYRHGNLQDLAGLLARTRDTALLVSEGVFSMAGDIAPLDRIATLAGEHDTLLAVDDAHGFGILGERGAGTCSHYALDEQAVPLLMATLGKAAGCHGAFIAGSPGHIDLLQQRGRSYIYSTALPAALAATASRALALLAGEEWRRRRLQENIERFRLGAQLRGLVLLDSVTPIQAVLATDCASVQRCGALLLEQKIVAGVIRSPTVPAGTERLRVSLGCRHTAGQIDCLLDALAPLQQNGLLA